VDLARNGGGPIFAAEDGVVVRADYGWNGGYGNVVEIDHGNGLVTLYAHNRELHVREGAAVRRGDVIATMGKTGRVYGRTGVHVHFEVIQNGVKKNPNLYLQ
jgi:murein DD-endopeptidase MepM/ murein hydrolase activator NlpD